MKKIKIFILSFLLIFLIFLIYFIKSNILKSFNDILFVKLFNKTVSLDSGKNFDENSYINNQFQFNISYENTNFKNINLLDTIDPKTRVYEKIAPGSEGYFNIVLTSNKYSKYTIKFESKNNKPRNLKFKAFSEGYVISDECSSLEELSKNLSGTIFKNEKKIITVKWYWEFTNLNSDENQDIQDTQDSKNIRQYNFNIYTIGVEA